LLIFQNVSFESESAASQEGANCKMERKPQELLPRTGQAWNAAALFQKSSHEGGVLSLL